MMTDDDLHDRLHAEVASVRPPGDLIPTLAAGHARRYRRTQRMKVGGAAVALVAVATTLTSVLAPSSGPSTTQSATSQARAEIIQRAKESDAAAQNMVIHTTTDQGPRSQGAIEGWALRTTNQSRALLKGVNDTVRLPDGTREALDYATKTVRTSPKEASVNVFSDIVGSGMLAPRQWYDNLAALRVDPPANGQVRLSLARKDDLTMSLWLDMRTYLPVRAEYGNYRITFEWLPPTADTLKSLTHTVPPDFTHEDGNKSIVPTSN